LAGSVDVASAALLYEKELISYFNIAENNLPVFDLILLGVGEDGHSASLFDGTSIMNETIKMVGTVSRQDIENDRVSLTLPVINSSRNVIFVVTGKKKAEVVQKIIELKEDIPANKIKPDCGNLVFLIDREAAGELSIQDYYSHFGDAISI